MPLQNRVTPFGEIVAIPARGLFTGNRGIIHDPATRTLTRRRWTSKAWLICSCTYKDVRRDVMGGRSWTELFFLDEATALAAGHRPCFCCRRAAAEAFRAAWAAANRIALPHAAEIDRVLHAERLAGRAKRLHASPGRMDALPTGTMLVAGKQGYLVTAGRLLQWSPEGYRAIPPSTAVSLRFDGVQTPPSTLRALAAGYCPVLHASARDAATGDV